MIYLSNFSSLGWFLFLSAVNICCQLLTADDSCYEKNKWDFHLPTKADICAKFKLSRLLGGCAREGDGRTDDTRQAKLMLLRLSWAGAWVEQKMC